MASSGRSDSEAEMLVQQASETRAPVEDHLHADVERLLSGRVRDIVLSPDLLAIYRKQSWSQRQKIVHSWMVWVSIISIGMVALSPFLLPDHFLLGVAICAGVIPFINTLVYIAWLKPRSSTVEGAIIAAWSVAIVFAYGFMASWNGGWVQERYLTGAVFVVGLGMLVLGIEMRWTLTCAAATSIVFLVVQLLHPEIAWPQAVALTCFYGVGLLSVFVAKRTSTFLAHRAFLMGLRDRHRSEALAAANKRLEELATTDALTGISNRRAATDTIRRLWAEPSVDRTTIAFVMIDIDHFKRLNDARGHAAGDECIRLVASTIASSVRLRMDVVSRYGGEEFLVVLTKANDKTAVDIAERIRSRVAGLMIPNAASDIATCVTVSIGVAMATETADPECVAKQADEALYVAKRQGRNRVCIADAAEPRPEHRVHELQLAIMAR